MIVQYNHCLAMIVQYNETFPCDYLSKITHLRRLSPKVFDFPILDRMTGQDHLLFYV